MQGDLTWATVEATVTAANGALDDSGSGFGRAIADAAGEQLLVEYIDYARK